MGNISPLEQVKLDAERITLKRIREQEEAKAWQESQDGHVALDDAPEVPEEVAVEPEVVEEQPKAKAVTTKKGK